MPLLISPIGQFAAASAVAGTAAKVAGGLFQSLMQATQTSEGTEAADPRTRQLEEIRQNLLNSLREAGVEPATPLKLQLDGFDHLRVDGGHPQQAAIDALLAAARNLVEQLRSLPGVEEGQPLSIELTADGLEVTAGNTNSPIDRLPPRV